MEAERQQTAVGSKWLCRLLRRIKTALETEIFSLLCFRVGIGHGLCLFCMLTMLYRRIFAFYSFFLRFSLTTQLKFPLSLKGQIPSTEIW